MGVIQCILRQFVHLVVNSAEFSISLQALLMRIREAAEASPEGPKSSKSYHNFFFFGKK